MLVPRGSFPCRVTRGPKLRRLLRAMIEVRELEKHYGDVRAVDGVGFETACAHVTSVLMDLDCDLGEINSSLGVISAQPSAAWASNRAGGLPLIDRYSCADHRVTVTVVERANGALAVRASSAVLNSFRIPTLSVSEWSRFRDSSNRWFGTAEKRYADFAYRD